MKRGKALLAIFSAGLLLTACGNPSEKGVEYLEKGEYNQAVEQFEQAIEKNKNTGDAWRGIGIAKWEQKDYKGARNAFRKALDNNAEKTGTIYNLIGNCDLKLGKAKEALNYYNLGLEQDDVSKKMKKEMKYNIIVAYEKMEDWESAEVKLEEYPVLTEERKIEEIIRLTPAHLDNVSDGNVQDWAISISLKYRNIFYKK